MWTSPLPQLKQPKTLTLIGAVCMGLVAVVPAVVVSIAPPVIWDAAAAVAFKLRAGAGVTAARFIAVVPAVVICKTHAGMKKLALKRLKIKQIFMQMCRKMYEYFLYLHWTHHLTWQCKTNEIKYEKWEFKWWQKLHRSEHAPWGNVPSTDTLSFQRSVFGISVQILTSKNSQM